MLRILCLTALTLPMLAATPLVQSTGPGTPFCFGTGCPCGNDDPTAGCVNSTGQGGLLTGSGTASIAAADLTLSGTHLPASALTLLVFSQNERRKPFEDGLLCVGPNMVRLHWHQNTGQDGAVDYPDPLFHFSEQGTFAQAGETWSAQIWYRDSAQGGVCGNHVNLTNGYRLTFTP